MQTTLTYRRYVVKHPHSKRSPRPGTPTRCCRSMSPWRVTTSTAPRPPCVSSASRSSTRVPACRSTTRSRRCRRPSSPATSSRGMSSLPPGLFILKEPKQLARGRPRLPSRRKAAELSVLSRGRGSGQGRSLAVVGGYAPGERLDSGTGTSEVAGRALTLTLKPGFPRLRTRARGAAHLAQEILEKPCLALKSWSAVFRHRPRKSKVSKRSLRLMGQDRRLIGSAAPTVV